MTYFKEEYTLHNGQKIYVQYDEYNICKITKECLEMLLDLYQQGRAEVIDSINDNIHEIYKCQFYCMEDMCEHDSPTVDRCIDCFYDAIQKSLEQFKEQDK